MFQNRKIITNVYEMGSRRCFVPPTNLSPLRIAQFRYFWNIGTLLYFQALTDTHVGTMWNNAGHYTNRQF